LSILHRLRACRETPALYPAGMSTLAEIEAAADMLPMEEKKELVRFLNARIRPSGGAGQAQSLLGAWQGMVTFREGWDEPLEVMRPYTK
jgi:hypothetical protein